VKALNILGGGKEVNLCLLGASHLASIQLAEVESLLFLNRSDEAEAKVNDPTLRPDWSNQIEADRLRKRVGHYRRRPDTDRRSKECYLKRHRRADMSDKQSKTVGRTMQKIAQQQDEGDELFYDPHSGILESSKKGQAVDDDRVPATEMAREGFFAC